MIRPRILIAESHPAIRKATIELVTAHFDVVGCVMDGAALVAEASTFHPDVIVSAIDLPLLNGIDAIHQLRESIPTIKVVFLTVHTEEEFIDACVEEGALGYVLKSQMNVNLIPAIQAALAGRPYIYSLSS